MLIIRETAREDLENIRLLWANGDVMMFVGFPDGLELTPEEMEEWYADIAKNRPRMNHFSVYDGETYLGEAFYGLNGDTDMAELDIKLLPEADSALAREALVRVIGSAFASGAVGACASISPLNEKAAALYEAAGMEKREMPEEIKLPGLVYYEIKNSGR